MRREEMVFADSTVLEGMTSLSALFAAKADGINDRPVFEVLFDECKKEKKSREFAFLKAQCRRWEVALRCVPGSEIDSICTGSTHGGVAAKCGGRTTIAPTAETLPSDGFLCLLDGIEDPYNFGYALRSLYAAGCDGILLGERNWLTSAGVVARASAGASEILPIFAGNVNESIFAAKKRGYRVVCAGIRDSVGIYEANLQKPILLVVGGEKRGISGSVISLADEIVRIDYGRCFRGSLSTAAATAIMAFEILHRNKNS